MAGVASVHATPYKTGVITRFNTSSAGVSWQMRYQPVQGING